MVANEFKAYAKPIEDLDILGELGLPELDDVYIPPAAIFQELGIPTPREVFLKIRDDIRKGPIPTPDMLMKPLEELTKNLK